MHIEEQMQKAVGRFDWPTVEARLKAVEPAELRGWAENLLDVILRDGYLIVRRPDTGQKAQRDAFLERLRSFLHDRGMADLLDERANEFSSLAHTEEAYQEVLASSRTDLLAHLSPEELAWAAIRAVDTGTREMEALIKSSFVDIKHMVDPVTAKLPVDADGVPASPDGVLNMLQGTLTATLKMLAYANNWFDRHEILVLPTPVTTTGEHQKIAGGNIYLATIWSQVERSDGRCRYFDGAVTREEVEFQNAEAPEEGPHRGDAVRFTFENKLEIELHIAGERLRRMFFGFFVSLDRDPVLAAKVVATPPVPPAPQGYVSVEEAHGALALSHLVFKSVFEIKTLFAGLTLLEWLRGYAVVQKLAREHLRGPQPADGVVRVEEGEVIKALTDHGLPEDRARVFFRHATFGKGADDVFDAPFARCRDGRFCFIVAIAAYLNPAFVVLSQLSSLRCDMAWKGEPFEANTLKLFRTHGVEATSIHRQIEGKELEIDCVALWDDILFVCEDKNYFLPGDNPQREFWFLRDQAAAARQVMKKVRAIQAHPEIVSEALGKMVTWKCIVPVVLNGSPFSLPGPIKCVHFYDSSALHRFFEDGFVSYSVDQGGADAPRPIPACTTRLWAGSRSCAEDLLRQMERPEQVVHALEFFRRARRVAPMSRRLYIDTIVVERLPSSTESLAKAIGMEEEDLMNNVRATADSGRHFAE